MTICPPLSSHASIYILLHHLQHLQADWQELLISREKRKCRKHKKLWRKQRKKLIYRKNSQKMRWKTPKWRLKKKQRKRQKFQNLVCVQWRSEDSVERWDCSPPIGTKIVCTHGNMNANQCNEAGGMTAQSSIRWLINAETDEDSVSAPTSAHMRRQSIRQKRRRARELRS